MNLGEKIQNSTKDYKVTSFWISRQSTLAGSLSLCGDWRKSRLGGCRLWKSRASTDVDSGLTAQNPVCYFVFAVSIINISSIHLQFNGFCIFTGIPKYIG